MAKKQIQTKSLNLCTNSMIPLHLLRRLTKIRASMSDSGEGWWLGVSYGEEKGVEDLQVSLKHHSMATKQTTHNNGSTLYEKMANGEKNRKN